MWEAHFLQKADFFCGHPACQRQTFSEPLPETVAPYARRTRRLNEALGAIGLALGGEAGSRLGPATLLRRVRQTIVPAMATPRVLGVEDWAWKRGHRYGAILVDLETHQVVDLLPVRTAEALAAWLVAHPGVEILNRDRAGAFAKGEPVSIFVDQWAFPVSRYHRTHNMAFTPTSATPRQGGIWLAMPREDSYVALEAEGEEAS